MAGESATVKMARMEEHVKGLENKIDTFQVETTKQIAEVKNEIVHLSNKLESGAVNALAIKGIGDKLDEVQKKQSKNWIRTLGWAAFAGIISPLLLYMVIYIIEHR